MRRTANGSILLTPKAATVYSLTGRMTLDELESASLTPPDLQRYLKHYGVSYIVLSHVHRDQWTIAARLLPYCSSYELVQRYVEDALALGARTGGGDTAACDALRKFVEQP